jgi:16S rRNA (guanine(966)-N(2))-methyltransferase RsmD
MRVIAGKYGSRLLRSLEGMKTRPTSDRLRETIFNVLTAGDPSALEGSVWLDLFAGTGAVGIEALSRGAAHVTFVESGKKPAGVIRENLRSLGIRSGFEVVEGEVLRGLRQLEQKGFAADYVFLDPPYAEHAAYTKTLESLAHSQVIMLTGKVVAEHDKRFDPGESFAKLRRYRVLEQGDSILSFYRRTEPDEPRLT